MKIAQICMLVQLPDEFEGDVDAVLEHLLERPKCSAPEMRAPEGTGQMMLDLRNAQWPLFVESLAAGKISAMLVVAWQGRDGTPDVRPLDVATFTAKDPE